MQPQFPQESTIENKSLQIEIDFLLKDLHRITSQRDEMAAKIHGEQKKSRDILQEEQRVNEELKYKVLLISFHCIFNNNTYICLFVGLSKNKFDY